MQPLCCLVETLQLWSQNHKISFFHPRFSSSSLLLKLRELSVLLSRSLLRSFLFSSSRICRSVIFPFKMDEEEGFFVFKGRKIGAENQTQKLQETKFVWGEFFFLFRHCCLCRRKCVGKFSHFPRKSNMMKHVQSHQRRKTRCCTSPKMQMLQFITFKNVVGKMCIFAKKMLWNLAIFARFLEVTERFWISWAWLWVISTL